MPNAPGPVLRWTRRPYGYRLEDGQVVADEHEADVLRRTADRLLEGASLASLVRELNAAGERTSIGRPWTVTGLRRSVLTTAARTSGPVPGR